MEANRKELTLLRVSGHNSPLLLIHSTVKGLVPVVRRKEHRSLQKNNTSSVCLFGGCFFYPYTLFHISVDWTADLSKI